MTEIGKKFEELVEIMAKLRSPDGCPWDREQTYKDIVPHTIEEVYEVVDAIERNDFKELKEELGDLLLQIVFYSQLASEEKKFTIDEVIVGITKKLIHRHPHVFGDTKVSDSDQVLERWEELKKEEGKSVVGGVPKHLPALLKAYRLGEKTSRVGFDWPDSEGILQKIEEEVGELHEAQGEKNQDQIEHEFGDLLFTLANVGRFLKIDPEGALRKSSDRFIRRFKYIEEKSPKKLQELSPEEWDMLWEEAKKHGM